MDDVSVLKFEFKMLRKPKKRDKNIFAYAAALKILQNEQEFLFIEDICIVDFAYQLLHFSSQKEYKIIPADSSDCVLRFFTIGDKIKVSSDWANRGFCIDRQMFFSSVLAFQNALELALNCEITSFFD